MYTLHVNTGAITRDSDGVVIAPTSAPDGQDYQAYLAWVAGGGVQAEVYDPEPTVRVITKLAFRRRFTLAERIALDAAREGLNPALPVEAVAALRTMQKDLDLAEDINLDDADVVAGLAFVQSLGLITAERAAEVLA